MGIGSRGVMWFGAVMGGAAVVAANAAETSGSAELETITVTAQKRSERIQDVPVPLTVLI